MENVHLVDEVPTIKDQLLDRFLVAKEKLGRRWRKQLVDAYPEFDSLEGAATMKVIADSVNSRQRRGQVDKIKKVVYALEKLAGIPHAPIL